MTTEFPQRQALRSSTGASARYLHPDVRRRQIVAAAARVFAEKGFPATRMSDIAARASISQGTIYRFFDSKEEIAKALFDVGQENGRKKLESLLNDPTETNAKVILSRYIAWYARFLAHRRGIVSALFAWQVDTTGRHGTDIGWRHWIAEQVGSLLREAGIAEFEGTDMGQLLPLLVYSLTALSHLHAENDEEGAELLALRVSEIAHRFFGIEPVPADYPPVSPEVNSSTVIRTQ